MKEYELTLLVDPKLSESELEEIKENLKKYFGTETTIEKSENWGRKQLAYKIGKENNAHFLHFAVKVKDHQFPTQLSKKLRVDKKILRYLLLKKE